MAMKYLVAHDQGVSNLPADEQEDHLGIFHFHIIEHAEAADTQFELGEWIGAKFLDCLGRQGGLVAKSGQDGGLQNALVTDR
jgi:hypothetical protein